MENSGHVIFDMNKVLEKTLTEMIEYDVDNYTRLKNGKPILRSDNLLINLDNWFGSLVHLRNSLNAMADPDKEDIIPALKTVFDDLRSHIIDTFTDQELCDRLLYRLSCIRKEFDIDKYRKSEFMPRSGEIKKTIRPEAADHHR